MLLVVLTIFQEHLDEMATASDVERKEIGRTYRFIIRKLGIKVNQSSPKDYVSRFSSVLKIKSKNTK